MNLQIGYYGEIYETQKNHILMERTQLNVHDISETSKLLREDNHAVFLTITYFL